MAAKPTPRPVRHRNARPQQRGERTRSLVIEETIRCVREEGFAAASTRHIVDRAGVSQGVIQYYFGDRDGLLTAVIEYAFATLTESLNEIADTAAGLSDPRERAESMTAAAWAVFFSPTCMTALEILIATRAMRGTLSSDEISGFVAALTRIAESIGDRTPHSTAIANLLWASPIGMMAAQLVTTDPLPTAPEQSALADLIGEHLDAHQPKGSRRRRGGR
jgi:TetR/AcrR family transcriptional regulator, regulator of cefoperazone and chloramphenicol sensitivity